MRKNNFYCLCDSFYHFPCLFLSLSLSFSEKQRALKTHNELIIRKLYQKPNLSMMLNFDCYCYYIQLKQLWHDNAFNGKSTYGLLYSRKLCLCGVYCFHFVHPSIHLFVHPSVTFWFLLLFLLNNLGTLLIFCINVDIDKMLLLHKNKGLWVNSFPFVILEKALGFCFLPC